MSEGYRSNLKDGRQIYIPNWSVKVQFENLTQACKYLGQDNVIAISTLSVPAAMLAIMGSDDPTQATELVIYFTQQARVAGEKITIDNIESLGMPTIVEVFTHVMHSQYNDFFVSGLAKAPSHNKSVQDQKV